MLVTEPSQRNDDIILDRVLYIHYPLRFRKDKKIETRALIDSGSKINAMIPVYALKLGLGVYHSNVGA